MYDKIDTDRSVTVEVWRKMADVPLNTPDEREKKLTGKQQQAALLLAKGSTIVDAAKQVGVNEKTIDDWKKKPAFKDAMRHAEDELYSEALTRLKRETSNAIECLVRNMKPDEAAPYVQVAAAAKIIDAGLQISKVQELEKLLDEMQGRLQDA